MTGMLAALLAGTVVVTFGTIWMSSLMHANLDRRSVLRLRSRNQTFEFILPGETLGRWKEALPARQAEQSRAVNS